MKQFAQLVQKIGSSTKNNDKLNTLAEYLNAANEKDKVWVIALFSGRRPKRIVSSTVLSQWCMQLTQIPEWLFYECYHTVGDLGETIALLLTQWLGESDMKSTQPLHFYLEAFLRLEKESEEAKKQFVLQTWQNTNHAERFVFNKLIMGNFRIGVSQKMMVNALEKITGLPDSVIAHRISGNWDAATVAFNELVSTGTTETDFSKPYPFYLAYALEAEAADLGDPSEWQAEWKWDGIRGQLIKRDGQLFVWSRGEELMTDKFPEYASLLPLLPDGIVLDGEIIPGKDGKPLPFALLQTRIGRKNITKKQLQEVPICFFAYDLLEYNYEDWRSRPLEERRQQLGQVVNGIHHPRLILSEEIAFSSWQQLADIREQSRQMNAEGIMLKRKASAYQVGRKKGDWWKWKIDPLTIDAVMVYAQKGAGRRSNLYTAYTFALRDGDDLIVFTRAYSGLTDKEFAQVDAFVKKNSIEKFGPVRTVKPELVFEIAFEGIAESKRHKCGIALRFPRMSRWRKDKTVEEINTLDDLRQLFHAYGSSAGEASTDEE